MFSVTRFVSMKILIAGSGDIAALELIYLKYLLKNNIDAVLFPAQNKFLEFYNKSLIHKLWFRTGFSGIYKQINKNLTEQITSYKPDIIWVFKGMEVTPGLLRWAKDQGIRIANYNPDNPYIFSGFGSGNKNITQSIRLFDLHFTYNLEIKSQLENEGLPVAFLPFGFDADDALYNQCRAEKEVLRTCFLGNPDQERAAFLLELANGGVEIDLYGQNWAKFLQHRNIQSFGPVYKQEFWRVLHKYRVQINLMRKHNLQSHNMRSFEIPGIGGIQLAPDTREHRLFFTKDKQIFLYNSVSDCIAQIKELMSRPADEISKLRDSIRNFSIQSGYDYESRTREVISAFYKLNSVLAR